MSRGVGETGSEGGPGTIGVTLTLFGDMKRYSPPRVDGPHRRAVPVGSTVAALLEALGVPADADVTVGVDGEMADRATPLRDGAEVMLLGPMEGGSAPAPSPLDRSRSAHRARSLAVTGDPPW